MKLTFAFHPVAPTEPMARTKTGETFHRLKVDGELVDALHIPDSLREDARKGSVLLIARSGGVRLLLGVLVRGKWKVDWDEVRHRGLWASMPAKGLGAGLLLIGAHGLFYYLSAPGDMSDLIRGVGLAVYAAFFAGGAWILALPFRRFLGFHRTDKLTADAGIPSLPSEPRNG